MQFLKLAKTPFKKGKIRDIYKIIKPISICNEPSENMLALNATNRLSGFDRYLCDIPNKGKILNQISAWWFKRSYSDLGIPNHLIRSDADGNNDTSVVQKCDVFPIEFVMRSYMTGSTQTSIWQNYKKGCRNFCGHELREGYIKNDKLDKILLTPTTKSDEHDEAISKNEIIRRGIMTKEEWNKCEEYAYKLFEFGRKECAKRGLILVDTKYEFGINIDGTILLVDEIHTPDSSRFWFSYNYEKRHAAGLEPDYIDKEFIRKWVKETYKDPYVKGLDIVIPQEMIEELSNRYKRLYGLITGMSVTHFL